MSMVKVVDTGQQRCTKKCVRKTTRTSNKHKINPEVEKVETETTAQNTAMAQKISRFEKQDNTRKSEDNTAAKKKPTLCTEVEKMLTKKYENKK